MSRRSTELPVIVVNLYGGTAEQFRDCLDKAMREADEVSGYNLVEIKNRQGKKTGYCYLFMDRLDVHYMILGRSRTGGQLLRKVKNKKWVRPEMSKEEALSVAFSDYQQMANREKESLCEELAHLEAEMNRLDDLAAYGVSREGSCYMVEYYKKEEEYIILSQAIDEVGFLWGDWEQMGDEIEDRYDPYIMIKGEPIIKVDTFRYTDEQIEDWYAMTGSRGSRYGKFKLWEDKTRRQGF